MTRSEVLEAHKILESIDSLERISQESEEVGECDFLSARIFIVRLVASKSTRKLLWLLSIGIYSYNLIG